MSSSNIRSTVRNRYGEVARKQTGCCGTASSGSCCEPTLYSPEKLHSIPGNADMGLGCGAPVDHAGIKPGEVVVDLGSGGGVDCFLAAGLVGKRGRVIGVDMTPEMIDLSRENASAKSYSNVEFRLGEIEHLPVVDNSADVVISNCVINLSPDKPRVFHEIYRVLKPGGRMVISDIVTTQKLPDEVLQSEEAYSACIAGAMIKEEYLNTIADAGFKQTEIVAEQVFPGDVISDDRAREELERYVNVTGIDAGSVLRSVLSITVRATKLQNR